MPAFLRLSMITGALALWAAQAPAPATAQMHGHGNGGGLGAHRHDEATMPGLRGENVTEAESAEMALLFRRFETLSREVQALPNGIRTITRSSDADVMAALVSHVAVMIGRVEVGDDPQVFIQSPTLDIFFERHDTLQTEIEITDQGIVVTQTSTDPELVAALQTHADEVSDMVERGMQAVHERMMRQHHGG